MAEVCSACKPEKHKEENKLVNCPMLNLKNQTCLKTKQVADLRVVFSSDYCSYTDSGSRDVWVNHGLQLHPPTGEGSLCECGSYSVSKH